MHSNWSLKKDESMSRFNRIHYCSVLIILFSAIVFPGTALSIEPRLIADSSKGEWTLFVIPDTQHYAQNRGNAPIAYMHSAFEWLVDTRDQLNIKFVQGLGDITESWNNSREWERASAAWNKLCGQIPFAVNQGNHDSIASINTYFPLAKFSVYPWWGGSYQGIQNSYQHFNFYGDDFLIVNIQSHDPWSDGNPGARQWANDLIAAHPDHKVLLGTHDTLETSTIKQEILTQHDNIVMSNAGHSCARETRFRTYGPGGAVTENFVTDYQCDSQETMQLRYYVFKPLQDKVDYYTYSPITDTFEDDYNSQGSFAVEMRADIGTAIRTNSWGQIKSERGAESHSVTMGAR